MDSFGGQPGNSSLTFRSRYMWDNRDRNQYPVVHILDTTTLSFASIMQRYWAGGACCRSQGPQASGRERRHWFWHMVTWGRHRKMPHKIALETTNQKIYSKLHCDRQAWVWYELLGSSEDSTFWVQNVYGEKSFESNTDWQLIHLPWRCSSWIATRNSIIPYRLSDVFMSLMSLQEDIAGMDSWNKTHRIDLSLAVHHILRTWAAERLAAPLPTHGG